MVIVGQEVVQAAGPCPTGWTAEDPRQLLRAVLRVSDLQSAVRFYARHFGLLLKQPLDQPGDAVQRAIVAADEDGREAFALELVEEVGQEAPFVGDWFSHVTLLVNNTDAVIEGIREDVAARAKVVDPAAAVIPIRSPSNEGCQSLQDRVAVVKDPEGYTWRLQEMHGRQAAKAMASPGPHERIAFFGLRVTDLDASLEWWCKSVVGARVKARYEASAGPRYRTALVGFGEELQQTLVELRQVAEPPLINRGTGWIRLVVGSADLDATAAAVQARGAERRWCELGAADDAEGHVRALRCTDPDGWEVCFVAFNRQ